MYKKTVLATFLGLLTGCGGTNVEDEIKALWYEHNMLLESEFSVEIKARDINNDGQTDWFTTSSYNCGSQGCTYELWSKVDNDVCMVGRWSSDIRKLDVKGKLQCNPNIFLDVEGYENASPLTGREFKLEIKHQPIGGNVALNFIEITPLTDLTVKKIELNRGKCELLPPLENLTGQKEIQYPYHAKWGEIFKVFYTCKGNRLREVDMYTNQGSLRYTFD
ncbi:hypothetical protein ACPSL3_03195 [Vibrio owensii]|uniref:hypothetical protein n=1 Tax=Vibrio harveyi group TaxID=717610 RepID=UPI003531767D